MANDEASSSSSSTKFRKCQDDLCSTGGGGEDRISTLPDAILGDILSSFMTNEAVRSTSVLSKRWRYVWTSIPCIDIDEYSLVLRSEEEKRKRKAPFVDFVDRVLRLNDVSPLKFFRLVWYYTDYGLPRYRDWMSNVTLGRDVKELDLTYIGTRQPYIELPPSVFACKKLVILKLDWHLCLNVPQSAFLPSLKFLGLSRVHIFDENSMKNLLAGCPVLEELDMVRDSDADSVQTLHIQSSSLKRLRLRIEDCFSGRYVLDAKNLERIDITDNYTNEFTNGFEVISLSSVVSVGLDVENENAAPELLRKLCKTKYLNVSYHTMQSLEVAPLHNLPVFRYLTHLVVEIVSSSWAVLPYLLVCSPNLITFEFIQDVFILVNDVEEVEFRAPMCSMSHLESINIFGFGWSKNEMDLVSYFLKKATVLKKMYIHPINAESNLCKELCMLPKSSPACEVEILSYNCAVEIKFPFYHSPRVSQILDDTTF